MRVIGRQILYEVVFQQGLSRARALALADRNLAKIILNVYIRA